MKIIKSVLLSTASVGVALGLALAPANAQTSGDQPPPTTNQVEGGATGGAEIQGQGGGTRLDAQGGAGTTTEGAGTMTQGDLKTQGQGSAGTSGDGSAGISGGADGELKAQSGTKTDDTAGATGESTAGAEGKAGAEAKASSEGKIELNEEQKTEIKQYFTQNTTVIQNAPKVERTAVSVSVGVAIPTHVRLVPLPAAIVVAAPSDCELMYFVWGSDVVIVDDCSRRVVEIIVNVA
jgi:hypothetical protein